MTRLAILTVAALVVSSALASAQTVTQGKQFTERAPTSQAVAAHPLILGVAY